MRPNWSFSFRFDEFPCFIAWPIVFLLGFLKIKPNLVTLVSQLCGIVFLVALFQGLLTDYSFSLFLLLIGRTILDCADGQLARYTGQTSNLGALYDLVFDFFFAIALFAILGYLLIIIENTDPGVTIPVLVIALCCLLVSSTAFSYIAALERSSDLYPAEVRRRFTVALDNDHPKKAFYSAKLSVFNFLFRYTWRIVSYISFLLVVNPEKSQHHASALGVMAPLEYGMHLTVLAFMILFQVSLVYFLMFEIIAFCALFLILLYHYRG